MPKSPLRGVRWNPSRGWEARYKGVTLGFSDDEQEAGKMVQEAIVADPPKRQAGENHPMYGKKNPMAGAMPSWARFGSEISRANVIRARYLVKHAEILGKMGAGEKLDTEVPPDINAIKEISNRIEGMPTAKIETTIDEHGQIIYLAVAAMLEELGFNDVKIHEALTRIGELLNDKSFNIFAQSASDGERDAGEVAG
jgi:hypothetical protein